MLFIEHSLLTHTQPRTDRIIDDIGGAFAMGCVGGGAWHLVKGLKGSPTGYRMKGALEVRVDGHAGLMCMYAHWLTCGVQFGDFSSLGCFSALGIS